MKIYCLSNREIDYKRWDNQLLKCHNQLSNATTWFLDIVSPGWGALVSDNYEYMMPLPFKKKCGIRYIVQPILSQQLGVFSTQPITPNIVNQFIQRIPCLSYELNFNYNNSHPKALVYPNFVIDLSEKYDSIVANYSKNAKRNISKAMENNLKVIENISLEEYFHFYFSNNIFLNTRNFSKVKTLIRTGVEKKYMQLFGVVNSESILIAAICILCSKKKITHLLPISNSEGKNYSAMFLLVDHLIRIHSSQSKEFDFEGSKIASIARFYEGFGAKNQPYFILRRFRPSFLIGKLSNNNEERTRQN
jgi:hypothetical protein